MEKVTPRLCLFLLMAVSLSCVQEEPIAINPTQKVVELTEEHLSFGENDLVNVLEQPSTNVPIRTAAYSLPVFQQALYSNQNPAPESIHLEQMINAWTLNYPEPPSPELVGIKAEMSVCPWNPENHLLRIGLKVKELEESAYPTSNYVVYLDLTTSMADPRKLEVVQAGLRTLVQELGPNDRLGIVAYGGSQVFVLDSSLGTEQEKILTAIDALTIGGPASNSHINLAYDMLLEHFVEDGHNRLILMTDNNFDLGPKSQSELESLLLEKSEQDIRFSICTVGRDEVSLEAVHQLATKLRGTHHHLDQTQTAEALFSTHLPKWYEVVKDVRMQVSFNPVNVATYRLLGYENRSVEEVVEEIPEPNRNFFGAGETATLLFEISLVENPSLDQFPTATINYRYKLPEQEVNNDRVATFMAGNIPFNESSSEHQFLAPVAGSSLVLAESTYRGNASLEEAIDWLEHIIDEDPTGEWESYKALLEQSLGF